MLKLFATILSKHENLDDLAYTIAVITEWCERKDMSLEETWSTLGMLLDEWSINRLTDNVKGCKQ